MGPFLTYMHAATASVSAVDLSNFSPIFFWTYSGKFMMTCVGVIIIIGHFAMQTGPHGWR